jgi:NADH:ubiquinone oxidoreductase subunit E
MKVKVCVGSNCTLLGAMNLLDQIEGLKEIISEQPENYIHDPLEVEAVKCMGVCKETTEPVAPIVVIDGEMIIQASGQVVMEKIIDKLRIEG